MARIRRYGCCSSGPAVAFGQLDPDTAGAIAGTVAPEVPPVAPGITLPKLFGVSVAAGVSVYLITRLLARRST